MEMVLEKVDLAKEFPHFYKAKMKPEIIEVGSSKFLSISGMGAPEAELFENSIGAIYSVAYTVKKYCKTKYQDFKIPKLECFWWVESGIPFEETPRNEWFWELIIRMPEFVDVREVEEAIKESIKKKNMLLANEVYLKKIDEGRSVQTLHIGSYDEEQATISRILDYMEKENLEMNGHHHEIDVSDPRKTPVERLKTVIRYAVKATTK